MPGGGPSRTASKSLTSSPKKRLLAPGERVMVQNSGGYQRVLPASGLPTAVKRPQGIKVID